MVKNQRALQVLKWKDSHNELFRWKKSRYRAANGSILIKKDVHYVFIYIYVCVCAHVDINISGKIHNVPVILATSDEEKSVAAG